MRSKKFMKLFLFVVSMAMVFCFAGCGSGDQTEESEPAQESEQVEDNEPVSGGWEVVADPVPVELPEDAGAAFESYMESSDDEMIPLAYFGRQIVAGTNYLFLCKSKSNGDDGLYSVVLQQDLDGNVTGAIVNAFNIVNYVDGEGVEATGEQLAGGWEIPENYTKEEMPEDAVEAFAKATETLDGNDLEAMALLGTQLVAGTNYAFLCHSNLVTAEPIESIQVVIVYADLDGNAEVTNINTLDLGSFNE